MKPIVFSSLCGRRIHADFDGGRLTTDAGGLLLRQVDQRLGLIDALNRCIPDPRDPEVIIHQQRTLLAQRILGIALGYEDLNDHQTLREDPLLQIVTERGLDEDQPLASPPTLCRLENRVHRKSLVKMAAVLVDLFIASFAEAPAEVVLDFDATDDPVHGRQEGRFFHGYYDHYYMPAVSDVARQFDICTAAFSVIRLHGPDREKIEEQTQGRWDQITAPKDAGLQSVAAIINKNLTVGVTTYVNVNNHYEGSAPLTIQRLAGLL